MAEGIMGLAPGMGAPAAPQQAPQQAGPDGMQAFLQAAGQMDSAEIEPQMDQALAEIDPALAQQLQAELSAIQLSPEVVEVLLDVVNGLLEAPGEYVQRRMEVIEAGLPADFLPEEFNVEYLSTLRFVLMRLPMQEPEVPVQGFKNGGAVSLKPIAKFLAAQGRGGDTMLAHINPQEAAMLKRMGGSGTINPVTGLPEYLRKLAKKAWKSVKGAVKSVAKAVAKVVKPVINVTKKLLANPIVRTVATVAAAVYLGPMAAKAVGAGAGTALSAAVGTSISTAGVSLLAGEKPMDALKQGLMAGTVAGVGSFAMGNPLTQGGYGLKDQYTLGNIVNKINPFSDGAPNVTVKSEYDKLIAPKSQGGFGLPADANTYRLAQEAASKSGTFLGLSKDNAITLASTLGPPLLANLGQEPPPSPEDLDISGVGGPTGLDLYNQNPGEFGINLGGTESMYSNPYADIASTPAMQIGAGTGGVGEVPMPGETPPPPGVSPSTPTQAPGMDSSSTTAALNPGAYSDMFKDYGSSSPGAGTSSLSSTDPFYNPASDPSNPNYNPALDPNSPLYNPFLVQTAVASSGQPVASFAKGGIATIPVQKFANGGQSFVRTSSSGGRSYMVPQAKSSPSTGPNLTADQRLQIQANAFKTSQAAKSAADRNRAQANVSASNAIADRLAGERIAQAAAERANQQAAAELKAKTDRAVDEAARAMASGNIYRPSDQYAHLYGNVAQQEAAIRQAMAQSPERFMTPTQLANKKLEQEYQQMLRDKAEFERVEADRIKIAQAEAAARAENERLQRQVDEFKKYQASILNPASTVTNPTAPSTGGTTGGIGTLPVTPPQNIAIGGTNPGTIPVTDAGATLTAPEAPTLPSQPISIPTTTVPDITPTASTTVYGPDGTAYASPQQAITMGIFNYSPYPPQDIPTVGIPNLQPSTSTFQSSTNPFEPEAGSGTFFTSDFSGTPAVGFAQGGIAAMAPYRFKSGSNPAQYFPRRTGPINGPGTGTSDSIPAMLSDGEFVFTAKAVKGMGNGSRLQGAKKMYKMMKMLEGKG
jgi:hypothetical protein